MNRRAVMMMVILGVLLHGAAGWCLTCGSHIVSRGDSAVEVRGSCGEPATKERREEWVEEQAGTSKRRVATQIEEWTYDFGPDRLISSIRFANGRVTEVRSGGYGSAKGGVTDTCRNGQLLSVGDTAGEVVVKCGEPSGRERREDSMIETTGGKKRRESVVIEEWTYNFGPAALMYFLTLENGRLKGIRTGGYGQ